MVEIARLGYRSFITGALTVFATATVSTATFACPQEQELAYIETPPPKWAETLKQTLLNIDRDHGGQLGVYIKDFQSGVVVSLRGDEQWYLASGIKVPVAIAVLRMVERGELSLDTELYLRETDYVDGAGPTNWQDADSTLTVAYLLKQMLTVSDNTASDILIRTVGIDKVNELTAELVPSGLGIVTSLADVRRHTYSSFHETAFNLSGRDFLALRKHNDEHMRIATLADILGMDASDFELTDLDSAFRAYYATNLNAGTLRAFGELLQAITAGAALNPSNTQYLLDLLVAVKTGDARIKAGLPESVVFAHKTGTQHRRACDLGIAMNKTTPAPENEQATEQTAENTELSHVVINVCTRDFDALSSAEGAMRAVGNAVTKSGILNKFTLPEKTNRGDSHE